MNNKIGIKLLSGYKSRENQKFRIIHVTSFYIYESVNSNKQRFRVDHMLFNKVYVKQNIKHLIDCIKLNLRFKSKKKFKIIKSGYSKIVKIVNRIKVFYF